MFRHCMLSVVALLFVAGLGLAQTGGRQADAVAQLVDAARGYVVISVIGDNGIRNYEIKIPPGTKFETADKKPIKEGLKDPMFNTRENRFSMPISIKFGKGPDGKETIQKVVVR